MALSMVINFLMQAVIATFLCFPDLSPVNSTDRTPINRATLNVGFPYNCDRGRFQNEAQALYRRTDYFDPERT